MSKALELPRLSEKVSLKGSGTSCGQGGGVSGGHRLQGISDWLWFLRGGGGGGTARQNFNRYFSGCFG